LSNEPTVKGALKHPKKALEYLILGKYKFDLLYNIGFHSCLKVKNVVTPMESRMILPTNIHEHLQTLHMLTIEFNLKNVLELGTGSGESTVAFLQAAHEIDGKVTSVDIDPCLEAKKLIKKSNFDERWQFIQSDDITFKWEQPIDHLYIDTSHTYEHTLKELTKFEPLVKVGGVITLHDIVSYPEVLSAINKYIHDRKDLKFYKYYNNSGLGILKKNELHS